MALYVNDHTSQYDDSATPITRVAGCTWTAGANGVDAQSGGRRKPSPDAIHGLVRNSEETSPTTPGWSLDDLDLAMSRIGVAFEDRSGEGWASVLEAHGDGLYMVLQGDSDVFGDATCSGAFDGPHAIGIHPSFRVVDERREWLVNDPICRKARWVRVSKLREYAEKFSQGVLFGVFETPVPNLPPPPPPPPTLKYGARALLNAPHRKKVRERVVMVRARPDPDARILNRKPRGTFFNAWQVVDKPEGRWFGNYRGTRWVRAGAFNKE